MIHRPTVLVLAGRALTALITVWCLGCSGFDPMLDALVGGSTAGMNCGPDMSSQETPASGAASGPRMSSPAAAGHAGYACGCGSCSAASPQSFLVTTASSHTPNAEGPAVIELASITRAPVAPPPQLPTV